MLKNTGRGYLQNLVQNSVNIGIDKLCDEFDLSVDCYPDVYLVTPENIPEIPNFVKGKGRIVEAIKAGRTFYPQGSMEMYIQQEDISEVHEETSHFVHYMNCKNKLENGIKRKDTDIFFRDILREMIGFFGSKFLNFRRKKDIENLEDLTLLTPAEEVRVIEKFKQEFNVNDEEIREVWIYQQGYRLGKRLFYSYIFGDKTKKDIRSLYCNSFEKIDEALNTFLNLKKNLDFYDI